MLWHAGEAEDAAQRFRGLTHAEREALLAFLGSL
ncbi:di-heme oxidoredictase family protein [Methylosinus sp. RM1]